jgi:hypothetical protein
VAGASRLSGGLGILAAAAFGLLGASETRGHEGSFCSPQTLTTTVTGNGKAPDLGARATVVQYNRDSQVTQDPVGRPVGDPHLQPATGRLDSVTTPRGVLDYTYQPADRQPRLGERSGRRGARLHVRRLAAAGGDLERASGRLGRVVYDDDFRVSSQSVKRGRPVRLRLLTSLPDR